MRRALVTLLMVVPLACGPGAEDGEEPAPPDTTVADTMAPPSDGEVASGTVGTTDFDLQSPGGKACIHIPAGGAPEGTVITVYPMKATPKEFSEGGRTVHSAAFEFRADSSFTIEDTANYLTIGLCAVETPHSHPHPAGLQVAHLDPVTKSVDLLVPVEPCELQCGGPPEADASQTSLLDGTLVSPSTLHATTAAMEGIGGKGAGLSPFAVVAPGEGSGN